MKVGELISLLQTVEPTLEVFFERGDAFASVDAVSLGSHRNPDPSLENWIACIVLHNDIITHGGPPACTTCGKVLAEKALE